MFKTTAKSKGYGFLLFIFCVLAVLAGSFCLGTEQPDLWDPAKYIGLDEIKPGMDAYCLTEYGINGIERFELKVIDVVPDFDPGRSIILVEGLDERFIHTGPVAGCSGSPVYIDGRMAGALAYAWMYSKDAIYGATPIRDMLNVGIGQAPKPGPAYAFDYSKPIDLAEIDRQIASPMFSPRVHAGGISALPCPMIVSGFPAQVCEQLSAAVSPFGFMVVPGIAGPGSMSAQGSGAADADEKRELVPGACLALSLVSGDMSIGVYGTVTEVRGDKVYGFGHPFMGYGSVDLPMATGKVHTVISSTVRSSKLARIVKTVGALRFDEGAGILGTIGAKAATIPVSVTVERYNDVEKRVYNCQIAHDRLMTPSLLRSVVSGAAFYHGEFPPDHTLEYKASIALKGFEPITFQNVSTGIGTMQMTAETAGSLALLMNNPYDEVEVESVDIDINILPRDITSHIWSTDLSDPKVKAGGKVSLDVVIESVRARKKKYRFDIDIPIDVPPGKYELTVCGVRDYEMYLLKVVPHRYIGQSLPDLVEALRDSLQLKRDRLYCYLVLPASGLILDKAELPDLPATKSLILRSTKRSMRTQLHPNWLLKTQDTGTIIIDKSTTSIRIEK